MATRIRIRETQFDEVRHHVEDFSSGEQAGFLLCSSSETADGTRLLAREWLPIPHDAMTHGASPYALAWVARFNAEVVERAALLQASAVLVHSHGRQRFLRLSRADERSAVELFPTISRLLPGVPSGSIVLGEGTAAGRFWLNGQELGELDSLTVLGDRITTWAPPGPPARRRRREHLDRQTRAIGPESDHLLAGVRVAVIGCSGGGSHVCQQLAHLGIGTISPIDDDVIELTNLSRMVGATVSDVGRLRTEVMRRVITSVDPACRVECSSARFPQRAAAEAVKAADIVVACVDSFQAREQINVFCRRHLIPLIDIGLTIETGGSSLQLAQGQVVVATPDSPCLRCGPLLSDAVLEAERRLHRPGYDRSEDAEPTAQVVSLNGVLASEACNAVLSMAAGFGDRGPSWSSYDGVRGTLAVSPLPPLRPECPACAELGLGDPTATRMTQVQAA